MLKILNPKFNHVQKQTFSSQNLKTKTISFKSTQRVVLYGYAKDFRYSRLDWQTNSNSASAHGPFLFIYLISLGYAHHLDDAHRYHKPVVMHRWLPVRGARIIICNLDRNRSRLPIPKKLSCRRSHETKSTCS